MLSSHLFGVCLFLYAFNLWLLWPGVMQADSGTALKLAQTGTFSGHVPVAYVKLWSMLMPNTFEQIPMLLIQVGLLWFGIYFLVQSLESPLARIVAVLLPFYPVFFHVNTVILREPQYIYAIFAGITLMMHARLTKPRLSSWHLGCVISLFLYAAAIKYQVRFIFPLLLMGVLYETRWFKNIWQVISVAIILGVPYGEALNRLDNSGIKPGQQTHSWQCVKIYDLAAMSYYSNKMYVPEFLKRHPDITLADIQAAYMDQWETLITFPNAPLRRAANARERQILLHTWKQAVVSDPVAYLRHRLYGVYRMFTGLNVTGDKPLPWAEKPLDQKIKTVARRVFPYFLQFPFLLLYLFWGFRLRYIDPRAQTLFFTGVVVLGYILAIMFNTLAFVPRYVYICNVLTVMLHPIALDIYLRNFRGKGLTNRVK